MSDSETDIDVFTLIFRAEGPNIDEKIGIRVVKGAVFTPDEGALRRELSILTDGIVEMILDDTK